MPGRHLRHQPAEQRRQQHREALDQPGALGDAQETQPQGQGAEQHHHHLDRQPGHGEQALDHGGEHPGIVADQPATAGGDGRDDEKPQPQAVEHVESPPDQATDDSGPQRPGSPTRCCGRRRSDC
ncbi:hypothetical protein D3C78_1542970 [compost metagenome]